jgi:hypothetical protein
VHIFQTPVQKYQSLSSELSLTLHRSLFVIEAIFDRAKFLMIVLIMKKLLSFAAPLLTLSMVFHSVNARAAAFGQGNLVVVQAGTGAAALNGNATAASLLEYTPGGVLVQSIALPTTASGANQPITLSGTATSEGFLTLSTGGAYLTMAGYGVIPGTLTPQTSTALAANRVVARIDMSGAIDTTTSLTDAYNLSNIRSAVSTDGTSIWTGGNGGTGQGGSAGTRYTTTGSTTSTGLHATTTNIRVVNIFNGQLYADSGSAGFTGIGTVGTGLSTTSGQSFTLLPGFPTTGTHSPYDFWFKDASTLYVADDGSAANGGGIQKWTESGGTWSLQYTLLNNGTTTSAVRGLAGTVDGLGNAVLYGTTGPSLLTVTDTGASALGTILATAPANTAFRGVELLAIPEPSVAGLAVLALFAWAGSRRARRC